MKVEVVVPKWGLTMEEAEVVAWMKAVGDHVALDEVLCELETDKITNEVNSPVAGIVTEIRAEVGQIVVPGEVIALVEETQ